MGFLDTLTWYVLGNVPLSLSAERPDRRPAARHGADSSSAAGLYSRQLGTDSHCVLPGQPNQDSTAIIKLNQVRRNSYYRSATL